MRSRQNYRSWRPENRAIRIPSFLEAKEWIDFCGRCPNVLWLSKRRFAINTLTHTVHKELTMLKHQVAAVALALSVPLTTFATPAVLPLDRGRPFDGFLPLSFGHAPPLIMATKVAQAIAAACPQFPLAVAVVDALGTPKIVLVPDQSEGWHGYSAVRKAWTALQFRTATTHLAQRIPNDVDLQAQVRANDNLMAFAGGRLWTYKGEIIGALAVSGAEPGSHDDDCLLLGVKRIHRELAKSGASIP